MRPAGRSMKKNFYNGGDSDIAMPALGEMPPILADTPELFGSNVQTENIVEEPVRENLSQTDENQDHYDQESYDSSDDTQQVQEEEVSEVSKPVKQDHPNFKALREAAERAKWENELLKSQMLEMQKSMQGKSQSQMPSVKEPEIEVDDFNFDVEDDALIEGKHAKRLVAELKNVKKQLKQFGSQSHETAVEAKIRAVYPDFGEVVSVENVALLNERYPDVAETLRDNPDLWKKASAAYSVMKNFGIYKEKDLRYEEDKMKAIKNAQKPRPVASVNPQQGDSPLSKANAFANGLSKDLQKQLFAEMQQARKNM